MAKLPATFKVMDDAKAEFLRLKTSGERLRIASKMFTLGRNILLSQIRSEHPDWSEEERN